MHTHKDPVTPRHEGTLSPRFPVTERRATTPHQPHASHPYQGLVDAVDGQVGRIHFRHPLAGHITRRGAAPREADNPGEL